MLLYLEQGVVFCAVKADRMSARRFRVWSSGPQTTASPASAPSRLHTKILLVPGPG